VIEITLHAQPCTTMAPMSHSVTVPPKIFEVKRPFGALLGAARCANGDGAGIMIGQRVTCGRRCGAR